MMTESKSQLDKSDDILKLQHSNENSKENQNTLVKCIINTNNTSTTNNNVMEDFHDFPESQYLYVPLDEIEPTIPLTEIPIELLELEGISPEKCLFPIKQRASIFTTYKTAPSLFALHDAKMKQIKESCKPKRTQKEESK